MWRLLTGTACFVPRRSQSDDGSSTDDSAADTWEIYRVGGTQHPRAQWSNTARNLAEISQTQATEAIPVVPIPMDSVSATYLDVKKNFAGGRSFGVTRSGQ